MHHIKVLTLQDFGDENQPAPANPQGWIVVARCADLPPHGCLLTADLNRLERPYQKDARNGMLKLLRNAYTGQPLQRLYDEKECHWCEERDLEIGGRRQRTKIWRIRNRDVRIVFVYGTDKRIYVLSIVKKKKDDFSKAELNSFGSAAQQYLDAVERRKITEH